MPVLHGCLHGCMMRSMLCVVLAPAGASPLCISKHQPLLAQLACMHCVLLDMPSWSQDYHHLGLSLECHTWFVPIPC